jgi:hypothetical protein
MQRYCEMTKKQISMLTREELEKFIAIELMEAGVVKPKKTKGQPMLEVPEIKKQTWFEVDGVNVLFDSPEKAEKFLELQPRISDYNWRIGSSYKYSKEVPRGVSVIQLYDKDDIERIASVLISNKAIEEANQKEQGEYEKAIQRSTEIAKGIEETYSRCLALKAKMTEIVNTFDEYVEMLEGDRKKALEFLQRAYPPEEINGAQEWFDLKFCDDAESECVPVTPAQEEKPVKPAADPDEEVLF